MIPRALLRSTLVAFLALLALDAGLSPASAQYRDRNDYNAQRYGRDKGSEDGEGGSARNVAGEFDYYALVLSWSPSHCAEATDDELQCNRRDGRRFNFVLHGLWPQYERGYPQDCRTARRPFVPQPLIDSMLDIMPSQRLVIHEFRKHGVCSGLTADGYFNLARRLFKSIRIPDDFKNPFEQQTIEPRQLASAFLRANPGLKSENFAIVCGGQGNRLKEIRICYNKDGTLRPCGSNEDQRRLCSGSRMFVPPVRSTARDDDSTGARSTSPGGGSTQPMPDSRPRPIPLPGPRMDRYERGI